MNAYNYYYHCYYIITVDIDSISKKYLPTINYLFFSYVDNSLSINLRCK